MAKRIAIIHKEKCHPVECGNKIPEPLLQIYNFIVPDNNSRVRIKSHYLNRDPKRLEYIQKMTEEMFGYQFKRAKNGLYHFKSKKVADYLRSIFIYEPAWSPITPEKEIFLSKEWNGVWLK